MNIITPMIATVIVVGTFCMGVWMGSHFYCPKAIPRVKDDRIKDRSEETESLTEADAERQRRFEEDLKAFEACMNYSLDKAYGQVKEQ